MAKPKATPAKLPLPQANEIVYYYAGNPKADSYPCRVTLRSPTRINLFLAGRSKSVAGEAWAKMFLLGADTRWHARQQHVPKLDTLDYVETPEETVIADIWIIHGDEYLVGENNRQQDDPPEYVDDLFNGLAVWIVKLPLLHGGGTC
jgi:hypothetical protein